MKTSRAFLLGVLLLFAAHGGLQAQGATPPTRQMRVPVTIVLLPTLPVAGEPFLIQRRTDQAPHDLILLPESATPELFSEAVKALMVARQASGDLPAFSGYVRARPHSRHAAQHAGPRLVFPWGARVLNDVRSAQPAELEGIGRVRSIQIWLPPHHRGPAPR